MVLEAPAFPQEQNREDFGITRETSAHDVTAPSTPIVGLTPEQLNRFARVFGKKDFSQLKTQGYSEYYTNPNSPKRYVDAALGGLVLALGWPVIGTAALAVYLEDGHNPFVNVAGENEDFTYIKIRSMVIDSELKEEDLVKRLGLNYSKIKHDPEYEELLKGALYTRIGTIIRSTSVDELGGVINLLKRDMSAVGPKPYARSERKNFVNIVGYDLAEEFQGGIDAGIKYGLVSPYQVFYRRDADPVTRARLEIMLMRNGSARSDFLTMLHAPGVIVSRKGAR